MIESGTGTALQRLELVLDSYEALRHEPILSHISAVAADVEDAVMDLDDADLCRSLIEDVRDVPLPPAQMEQVLEAVSGAMARLLVSWGGYMNLEELDAAVSKLLDFGKSTTAVREALGSALTEFIDHIDDTLGEIDDPDDLDSFESELNGLMKRCGYSDSRVERDVDYRRQTLYERGPRRSRSQYGGFARAEEKPDVSDEEIRSMFRELSR